MATSFCLEAMKDNAIVTYSMHDHQDINEIGAGMWLIDSGCNKHISPFRKDFRNVRETDITCTFGNKGQIKAEGIGEVEINILGKRKNDPKLQISRVTLKNVLYVPELSTRLLSSGCLRRTGGKFVESNDNSALYLAGDHTTIPLTESGNFLWLKPHITSEKSYASTVYAPGSRETASASLLDWHEMLGHSNPSSILYLGQRGFINITGEKKLTGFNC